MQPLQPRLMTWSPKRLSRNASDAASTSCMLNPLPPLLLLLLLSGPQLLLLPLLLMLSSVWCSSLIVRASSAVSARAASLVALSRSSSSSLHSTPSWLSRAAVYAIDSIVDVRDAWCDCGVGKYRREAAEWGGGSSRGKGTA
jgi:hypothetical protein